LKRLTISLTGSTSSIGSARARSRGRSSKSPRRVIRRSDWSSTRCGVLLEDVVAPGAGGVLQPEDRLGVEQVRLALAAPLVLAADLELRCGRAPS
jgi:hypothetical protein